jgi:hypothetical protein
MLKLLTFYLSLLCTPFALAGQLYIQLENDVTFGEDGNYSNGMIVAWESDLVQTDKLDSPLGKWQSKWLFNQELAGKAWGLKISQRMWTPDEIKIIDAQPFDRPYAGFLELEHHTAVYSSDVAQKNWLSIGVIGPASGTEHLQGNIHKLLGASTPEGWAYQIENQVTLQIAYELDYLLLRKAAPFRTEWEVSTFSHNALGNLRSEMNLGLTLRWGRELSNSFGRLSHHFGHSGNSVTQLNAQTVSAYVRMQLGYRFNDLTMDGNLPYTSQVQYNPKLASGEIGAIYYYSSGTVTWSFNIYNKEYLTDVKAWHGYGKLQFSWAM